MKGESPESTSAHGLHFLDAIRRTSDKHGRVVAGYFEHLLPREGNEDYYSKISMPISFRVIERKLHREEFENLSELECWLKRMVTNAKEYYPKNSTTFDDAERIRKATSNWMVKFNPAYKKIPNYAATPIPIPSDYDVDAELAAEDMPTDVAAAGMPERPPRRQRPTVEAIGDDAEGETDENDEDDDAAADETEDAEADTGRAAGPRIVLKRRGARSQEAENTPSTGEEKADNQYSQVPYQGLSFQEAQEKIIDTLMGRQDEDDEWPYFEPFINLPDKSLKDYYQLIEDPMSLKKLWRAVKGMQGRGGATGISHFKSWAAMEERASLLWNNAFYYNEEGSEISELAKELKDAFYEQLNEAKACVEEPPQPKIKLRAPSTQTPTTGPGRPKRITIHVGGGREDSQGSPASQAGPSGDTAVAQPAVNGGIAIPPPTATSLPTPGPAAGAPPTPTAAVKREDSARQSPAIPPQVSNGYSSSAFRPVMTPVNGQSQPQHAGMPNGHAPPVVQHPPRPLYEMKYRGPGTNVRDAILTNFCIRTPLDEDDERRFSFNIPPHPKLLQQSLTVTLGPTQWKLQLLPRISPALEEQQRAYKMYILVNGQVLARGVPNPRDPPQHGEAVYNANLHAGVNTVTVYMIAALPKGQTLPNGSDAVMEKITILANVTTQ
ncbi:Bromodomain-containing protein [Cryphonectria parasitica EP155]|uniref:Bromodomain-containing protein n=1 Tax=Cryphonectria parasitica (strain ATCC 38755 / EP155) TaxID=660469 RepID=A0A9P5CP72_CRYP1|nr:Bromodomain-containing protein [Cryphonectria parasitica EP155]KAF3764690.1 Bromodomain-containing protein [Cryphonectria parasitica EP155]